MDIFAYGLIQEDGVSPGVFVLFVDDGNTHIPVSCSVKFTVGQRCTVGIAQDSGGVAVGVKPDFLYRGAVNDQFAVFYIVLNICFVCLICNI